MTLIPPLIALAILAVCSFAPGFWFVRRMKWNGLEKLCASIALSLILLWLGSWSAYVFAPGRESVAYPLMTAVCAAMGAAAWRDAAVLFRSARVRGALVGVGFLLGWTLLLLCIIRNYSGAGWTGDWLEHFQRSLFFLHHFPVHSQIYGNYQLPARPPAMNVFGAFVMAQAGDRFEVFQATFAFLNLLVFLPCLLALPVFARPRRPRILPLVAIFAASPMIMQNATYTWTKALPAFFVILAILLYYKAWRKQTVSRFLLAFAALAMGLLVHYSAGPYLAFLALHCLLFVFWRRPSKWREIACIAGIGAGLVATWFGWSMKVYGVHATLASNTSVTSSQQYEGHNLEKIAGNLVDAIVPPILRDPALISPFDQPNRAAMVRDNAFILYQQNLIFCMGSLGGLASVWVLAATLRKRLGTSGERTFWAGLVVWTVVIGIAVVGESDPLGVAHLTLVPMAILGMTLVASRFQTSRALALVVIAGCVIDFSLGVFLHARIQHLDNTPGRTVYTGLTFEGDRFTVGAPTPDSLSQGAWANWLGKHQYRLAEEWRRSVDAFRAGDPALDAARADARARLTVLMSGDDVHWHGWYRRHGGEVELLGDHFGDGDAMSAILVLVFAGLMWQMICATPSRPPVVAQLTPTRARKTRRK